MSAHDTATDMRTAATAAIGARAQLGEAARRAVIDAVNDGWMLQDTGAVVLDAWGLPPLPWAWWLSGSALLTYHGVHTDPADARRQAGRSVSAQLRAAYGDRLLTTIGEIVDVAATGGGEHDPQRPYQVTLKVGFTARIIPADNQLIPTVEARIARGQPALAAAGQRLGERAWRVLDGPIPPEYGPGTPPVLPLGPVEPPPIDADLDTLTAIRDAAVAALADLRAAIRTRLLRLLAGSDLACAYWEAVEHLDGLLHRLGLPGLPHTPRIAIAADVTMVVAAATAAQAAEDTRRLLLPAASGDRIRIQGQPPTQWHGPRIEATTDDRWRVTWTPTVGVWLPVDPPPADAAATAEALVRRHLTGRLAGTDIDAIVLRAVEEDTGADPLPAPPTD